MIKIGILTSSRADFGIYLPLLTGLKNDSECDVKIIAFGTHLSYFYGETKNHIKEHGFDIAYEIESLLLTDTASSISTSIGLTIIKFADFWRDHALDFDIVFCLGDRYEMFAAVVSGITLGVEFAHLHGGEKTLGAIDNIFRHSITLASKYHFVSTENYKKRVAELTNKPKYIYNVGALSLDNLNTIQLLTTDEFKNKWGIDINKKTILLTFHPETVALKNNKQFVSEIIETLNSVQHYQIIITMPNADTAGNLIREQFIKNFQKSDHVFLIENLGVQSYFTALKHCSFLLGNTSSGIIEAASFGKYVINIGDRQLGRDCGPNVLHSAVNKQSILKLIKNVETSEPLTSKNIYWNGGASNQIIKIMKAELFKSDTK